MGCLFFCYFFWFCCVVLCCIVLSDVLKFSLFFFYFFGDLENVFELVVKNEIYELICLFIVVIFIDIL